MNNILMFILILIIIIFVFSFFFTFYLRNRNNNKLIINKYQKQINDLDKQSQSLIIEIEDLNKKCDQKKKDLLVFNEQEEYLKKNFETLKETIGISRDQYIDKIENSLSKAEYDFDVKLQELEGEKEKAKNELGKIKDSINAGIKAQLREQEKENNLDFYKLQLPQGSDLADFNQLLKLKETFYNQSIIAKLIWSQYFQKQTTDLCNRVVGKEKKSGIYKITNLEEGKVYIGQSINISDRFKSHIKCGIGIDTSSTNKLYQSMLKSGIWNFTFEVLEECSKDQLNEKERQWIEIYQSNIYGLNTLKGVN